MREPAKTRREAVDRFRKVLGASLGCVSKTIWYVGSSPEWPGHQYATTDEWPMRLRRTSHSALYLDATIVFHLAPDPRFDGEWKVFTDQYIYALSERKEDIAKPMVSWHWHPRSGRDEPHVHVPSLPKRHVPSGRVSFESVLRFLIVDFGVRPERKDWSKVLADSEGRFREYRSWS